MYDVAGDWQRYGNSLEEDRMRSFCLGIGWGMVIGAIRSLLILTLLTMSGGLDAQGTTLMIAVGANLVVGIVVGLLGARFARPGSKDGFPWAGLGGFLLALFVLYPLLTFAFDTAVTSLTGTRG
jgi:hypothetical protein